MYLLAKQVSTHTNVPWSNHMIHSPTAVTDTWKTVLTFTRGSASPQRSPLLLWWPPVWLQRLQPWVRQLPHSDLTWKCCRFPVGALKPPDFTITPKSVWWEHAGTRTTKHKRKQHWPSSGRERLQGTVSVLEGPTGPSWTRLTPVLLDPAGPGLHLSYWTRLDPAYTCPTGPGSVSWPGLNEISISQTLFQTEAATVCVCFLTIWPH